jgi:AraC family transcriptional regulator
MVADQTACGQPLSLTVHRGFEELPPHSHVNDYVCIVLSGGFEEVQGDKIRDRPSGMFFTHEAGDTHYDRNGARGAVCLNLHFSPGESGVVGIEGFCAVPARVAAEKLAFELAASCDDELVTAGLAAEIHGQIQAGGTPSGKDGDWMGRVVEAISDEPRRRWTLGQLAEIADRHPVRLAQAFRLRAGMSVGEFQRLRRLTNLGVALRRRSTPLATIAVEFGYCDQSHMTSEFRRAFGISPGRYRHDFH